ncbi:haloacid dehalogenase [Mycobacterium sp. ACS1612]|nr:haloacid dehalogenase [Mycobacterium sp. ACS1612]
MDFVKLMRSSASLPFRVLDTGVRTASAVTAGGVGQVMTAITDVVSELAGGARSRRCWEGDGRCWIEVRGLTDAGRNDRVGQLVAAKLRARPGVRWVKLNQPLSRVVVQLDEDAPTLSDLCGVVDVAEKEADQEGDPGASPVSPLAVELPGDTMALAAAVTAAATSAVGLSVTLAGRALLWPRLPAALAATVTLVDYQPRLRRLVEDRLGADGADTALAFATSAMYTFTQAPASLAVDLALHIIRAAEAQSAAQAWRRREPGLANRADCSDGVRPSQRPRPMPPGPVERHGDRCGVVQGIGAATVGFATGSLDAAATAALVAAPKAARTSREAFAATIGRGLADHHGVLPLAAAAFRRLDRIDTVVIDPRALCTDQLRVGRIRNATGPERTAIWQWADKEIDRGAIAAGWHRIPGANGHRPAGEALVRYTNHPLASAVLREARSGGADVVSLDLDSLDELRSGFDDLYPYHGSVDQALAQLVTRLQEDGRTVMAVTRDASQAVADADVGICIGSGPAVWHADLLVDDVDGVWRIMRALPAARRVSERGVEIATGASLLGALLMIPGVRGRGPGPVTAGAGAGAWTGYRLARGVLNAAPPVADTTREWHALSVEQVRRLLPPPPKCAERQAKSRLSAARSVATPLRRNVSDFVDAMRDELSDPLTPVLAIGSAASAVLGSPSDAVLVGSVLTGNAALAATQKLRAERLLRRLLAVQDPPARCVLENQGYATVDTARLRPGDLIEVRPGEVVPADARLVRATDVEVDESSLTGESLPVPKQVDATPAVPVAERACMLHATTTVVAGTAVGIVTAVGGQTQARRAMQAPGAGGSSVGLQAQLRDLTDRAWPVSIAGGGLVTMLGLLRRTGLRRAVSSGVAVSVAAVPEGLPLVATLAQQASARRLTRSGALVRSPRSVEALGRVDVVCFDKTGTLSENRLRVTRIEAAEGMSDDDVLAHAGRATPPANGDRHEHATDSAVAKAAEAVDDSSVTADVHLPFRSGRPFSASIRGRELSIKGAPEVVLPACSGSEKPVQRLVAKLAEKGLRVLAVARRQLTEPEVRSAAADPDAFAELCTRQLQFVGFLGLSDTPRPDAAEVLTRLTGAGVAVRLITGDHPVTATAIADELGMAVTADQVMSGAEWEALARREQERAVQDRVVFARMSPEHKVQIVETLERTGRVCAMVGDGANDAAAIRAATVGIGVASHGSDPARTAADVMLLEGRIGSLMDALDEGNRLWRRVQAAVAILLGGNAGEVGFALLGTALTGRSPLNTRQLLLVNMLTDALPAAALAVSEPTGEPANGHRGLDEAELWRTVAVRGATTAGAATAAWALASVTGTQRRASTVALVALVSAQLGQTLIDSRDPLVVSTAVGSLMALGGLISTPVVSQLLGSTPLGPLGWAQALGAATVATSVAAVAPRMLAARGWKSVVDVDQAGAPEHRVHLTQRHRQHSGDDIGQRVGPDEHG